MKRNRQQGVGLIEVMVALLILAIAVLGFVALQIRAMEATVEGGYRIQAINIARDLAEKMRVNRDGLANYTAQMSVAANQTNIAVNCATTYCSAAELADYDVSRSVQYAQSLAMTMNMMTCPGIANARQCIYVAWGETSATNGTGLTDCTNGTTYRSGSTCVIMEVY